MRERGGSSRPKTWGLALGAALIIGAAAVLVGSACGGDGSGGGGGDGAGGGEAPTPAAGSYATDVIPSPDASTSYALLFVVKQGATEEVAAYLISCGPPGWNLPTMDELIGTSVKIEGGRFTIDNAAVTLNGRFTDSVTIEGTLSAKSEEAGRCGVPRSSASWVATCGKESGIQTLFVEGQEVPLKGSCTSPS